MKRNGRIRTFTCRLAVLLLAMMLAFLTAVPASAAGTSTKSGTQSGTQSSGSSGTQSSSSKSGTQSSSKSGTQSTSKKDERKIIKAEEDGKTVLYFETDPDWKIRYSEEITDELVETEMAIFSVFPIQFVRHIRNCSKGVTVTVLDKLPKDASMREEYTMAPVAPDLTLHFAHNTAFLSVKGSDKVISHHLDGLDPEAEKKWDEVLKPETIRLYHRYQDSLPKSGEVSVEDSIVNFLKNNYLWLFLNCPNLLAILLEK
ncbi:MAG: hypothetical protein IIY28_09805 [Lachnospiraceae bacterium]|nr:hypothetical protein [Lachnospiraceae bacterium]